MPIESEQPDLSLVPTEDLIEALKERHETLFIVGRPLGSEGDANYDWRIDYCGDFDRVMGLIHIGSITLAQQHIGPKPDGGTGGT